MPSDNGFGIEGLRLGGKGLGVTVLPASGSKVLG